MTRLAPATCAYSRARGGRNMSTPSPPFLSPLQSSETFSVSSSFATRGGRGNAPNRGNQSPKRASQCKPCLDAEQASIAREEILPYMEVFPLSDSCRAKVRQSRRHNGYSVSFSTYASRTG